MHARHSAKIVICAVETRGRTIDLNYIACRSVHQL